MSAESDLQDIFYAGEKPPHMWWDEFEIRLTNAFAIVDKDAGRQVHTNVMKLRLLNKKIHANFLTTIKAPIEMQMAMIPVTVTYESALVNYRNVINQRFPQGSVAKKTNKRLQPSYTKGSGRGRQGRRGNYGCNSNRGGSGGGRGRGNSRRNDNWEVIGIDGRTIRVHPAYQFDNDQWFNIPEETHQRLVQLRREYRNRKRSRDGDEDNTNDRSRSYTHDSRQVSQAYSHYGPVVQGTVYGLPPQPPSVGPPPPPRQAEILWLSPR